MFLIPLVYLCYALVGWICLKLVKLRLAKRKNAREAARRGCLPPPTVPSKGLFGIKTLRESIRATKEERGVQWIKHEMDSVGKNVHTVRATIFDYELLLTRDGENVKAMFASQAGEFDIGPHREKAFKELFGLGVMTGRGQAWKHSRSLLRPQFARDQIMALDLFETHFQALNKKLVLGNDSWTSKVDLSPLFFNLTLDISTEFLVGESVHSQDPEAQARLAQSQGPNAPDLASFGESLDAAKVLIDRRGAMAKYGWLLNSKEYPKHCKTVQDFVDYFVSKELVSTGQEKHQDSATAGRFVLLHELAKETRDPLTLRNEILNVLHAARDTTASLLGWIFYFLARHPDVFSKLRSEVVETFSDDPSAEVTSAKIWTCTYMTYVINEAIRYVGIVPMNERAAVVDTTLPRGGGPDGTAPIFVPKGTQVLIPTYAMQHREDVWGADVEEFKPERWAGRKHNWNYVPFGGGARGCMGQQLARTEAMYVIIRLLQTYDQVQNMEVPERPIQYHHSIENRSGTGVQVRLHAAHAASMGEKTYIR